MQLANDQKLQENKLQNKVVMMQEHRSDEDADDEKLQEKEKKLQEKAVYDYAEDEARVVIYGYPCRSKAPIARESVLDFFYPYTAFKKLEHKKCLTDENKEKKLRFLQMRRDIFLLAFEAVQRLPPTNKWSFFQIAGIHGLPYRAYDPADDKAENLYESGWGGYCQHGTPLFPTWHRPYVMLLEQAIIRRAKVLFLTDMELEKASKPVMISDPDEREMVRKVVRKLRMPYWDWADPTSRIMGIPEVFTTTDIALVYPWKSFSCHHMPNPLKAFVLPENVGVPVGSDVYNPSAKPNYAVPSEATPFIPLGYPTVRHVSSAYSTQNDNLNLFYLRNTEAFLVAGVHGIFRQKDWLSFSNHSWPNGDNGPQSGHFSSLELVHDYVHNTVGGVGGQMAYVDTAAFDPIFFFHHCNVDRLVALWQYCYPDSWIPNMAAARRGPNVAIAGAGTSSLSTGAVLPNYSNVDASTYLMPFRWEHRTSGFITSDHIRHVEKSCGYSYPEILQAKEENWGPEKMLSYVLELYKPLAAFYEHRWFLELGGILKRAFNVPYNIRVFLDLPEADASTSTCSPHFAGYLPVFARSKGSKCANCDANDCMRGSVELTSAMLRLGRAVAPETKPGQASPNTGLIQSSLERNGAITLVLVTLCGRHLNPAAVPGWEGGPQRFVKYQPGNPSMLLSSRL